ncbi:MAG: class I SAM-dependent methyltransferase [Phycisphaerae bacterium]|nr:class I SAM-dependent methyltransferase [Phycisphaerae bacterium]
MTGNSMVDRYKDGTYISDNPDWDRHDASWKAGLVRNVLQKFSIEPKSVCDVGCGAGDMLLHLKQAYPDCDFTGYDISPQLSPFWDEHRREGIHFHCGDIIQLNRRYYDCILLMDVIEHLSDPFSFLDALRSMARYFIFHFPLDLSAFTVMRKKPLLYARHKVGHIHYFTKELALDLLQGSAYCVMHHSYTNAYSQDPRRSLLTRLTALPRHLVSLLDKDFGTRLLGGETLIVLAEAARQAV